VHSREQIVHCVFALVSALLMFFDHLEESHRLPAARVCPSFQSSHDQLQ
jgi:hypothetical protein